MDSDWCRDISIKRISLMYSEDKTKDFSFMNQSKQISTSAEDRVKLTQILKVGQGRGSVFLDISNREETLAEILQLIAQQYPSRNGVLIRRDKDKPFLEINFDVKDSNLDVILNKGVTFNDQSVVIPCIALDQKINTPYVRLYNLPLLTRDKLHDLLRSSLIKYGTILDIGILVEPSTDTYMGTGYAILDTECVLGEPLSHVIECDGDAREFYAVWEDMPDFCYCCHSNDHAFNNCSKRVAGKIYPEPVFENKMDEKEEEAYNCYILFILKMERRFVNITVEDHTKNIIHFKLKRNIQMRKVMEAYSESMVCSLDCFRFLYDGLRVLGHHTPDDFEMNDGDNICVFLEQHG